MTYVDSGLKNACIPLERTGGHIGVLGEDDFVVTGPNGRLTGPLRGP